MLDEEKFFFMINETTEQLGKQTFLLESLKVHVHWVPALGLKQVNKQKNFYLSTYI